MWMHSGTYCSYLSVLHQCLHQLLEAIFAHTFLFCINVCINSWKLICARMHNLWLKLWSKGIVLHKTHLKPKEPLNEDDFEMIRENLTQHKQHLLSSYIILMAQIWPYLLVFATLLLACHRASSSIPKLNNVTDQNARLSFKSTPSDASRRSLASWNNSIHFCEWPGISCGSRGHPQCVISLVLSSIGLTGPYHRP